MKSSKAKRLGKFGENELSNLLSLSFEVREIKPDTAIDLEVETSYV
jgi:hypothetical protein